jgi:hypothetical protein
MTGKRIKSWVAVKNAYVNGGDTFEEIAHRFGIHPDSVRKHAARDGWTRQRAARMDLLVEETARQSVIDAAQQLATYNAEDLRLAKQLRQLLMCQLRTDRDLSACDLRQLAGAAESCQRVARLALGASTSNEVPVKPAEPEWNLQALTEDEWEALNRLLEKCGVSPSKGAPTPGGNNGSNGKIQ